MKTITFLILVIGLSVTTIAQAERGHGRGPSIEQRIERMTAHLGLSVEQQTAVLALMEQHRPDPGADRQASRAESRAAFETELEGILSAEQMELFQQRPRHRSHARSVNTDGGRA